jgi:flagellar hook-length control protein FliK
LKTQHLGPQFDLITSATPQPDEDSLAAFAKAQGLDDRAVQALFGDLKPLHIKTLQSVNGSPTDAQTGPASPNPSALASDSISASALLPGTVPGWFTSVMPPQGTSATTGAPGPVLTTSVLNMGSTVRTGNWPVLASGADAANAADGTVNQPFSANGAGALATLLTAHGAQALIKAKGGDLTAPLTGVGAANPGEIDAHALPTDAMRLRLIPAWENMTRQLADANGTGQTLTWANLLNGLTAKAVKAGSADSVIDLGENGIGASTDTGDGMGTVSATFNNDNSAQMTKGADQAPALNLSGKAPGTEAPGSGSDRTALIGQLADKLGQALSERLQNQIEQGQWKMELRLKPAHLGKISVELDMNSAGLDAVFKTDNPLTRDLIAQGTQRLRDNLAQAGMTVANVWVNSNNQQSTGGNSTPRQMSTPNFPTQVESVDAVETKKGPNIAKSSDGWDELV